MGGKAQKLQTSELTYKPRKVDRSYLTQIYAYHVLIEGHLGSLQDLALSQFFVASGEY